MAVKRAVVGIPFNYDESWIGGTYYVKNLVSSLNLLAEQEQPDVWILCHASHSFEFIKNATQYPRLHWMQPALIANIDGGISRKTKWLNRLAPWFLKKPLTFDLIYPYPIDTKLQQTACWIPDFQDKVLPDLFSEQERIDREKQHRLYFENYRHVVFSSFSAKQDFETYYPAAQCQKHVVHFAVFDPPTEGSSESILEVYGLTQPFFYCPNQFWIHKNHSLVIDAVALLRKQGVNLTVVFSGKEHDHRAPNHTAALKQKCLDLGIEQQVKFLGFIPREHQVCVFRESIAVIQPSLFEGWSTVIEDAKSLGKHVIASSIPANKEQLSNEGDFFEPNNASELAQILAKYLSHPVPLRAESYEKYQHDFAQGFKRLIDEVRASTAASA
jgi:glycosyltransferase involved in cell wall biosynthesis